MADRTHLVGTQIRTYPLTIGTEWVEEFCGITGEAVHYREVAGGRVAAVPLSLTSVLTLNICQQRWFDLAEALETSWTEGTLMVGEQSFELTGVLEADVPYTVTNAISRVDEKQGRVSFDAITMETKFIDAAGCLQYRGTNTYIVFK